MDKTAKIVTYASKELLNQREKMKKIKKSAKKSKITLNEFFKVLIN